MRVDVEKRIARTITLLHRPSADVDEWEVSRLERCMWIEQAGQNIATDGVVEQVATLIVQVPEDLGEIEVSTGDWFTLAEVDAETLTTAEVKACEGLHHVIRVTDKRGGLHGAIGVALRFASVLVCECD